jgi:hypothetical protein
MSKVLQFETSIANRSSEGTDFEVTVKEGFRRMAVSKAFGHIRGIAEFEARVMKYVDEGFRGIADGGESEGFDFDVCYGDDEFDSLTGEECNCVEFAFAIFDSKYCIRDNEIQLIPAIRKLRKP